jgi:hypothetical protein
MLAFVLKKTDLSYVLYAIAIARWYVLQGASVLGPWPGLLRHIIAVGRPFVASQANAMKLALRPRIYEREYSHTHIFVRI